MATQRERNAETLSILRPMKKQNIVFVALALTALPIASQADSSFFITPSFRGQANTEYAGWDVFTNTGSFNFANSPDRPGSTGNGTITQTTPGAFVTGSGNIYSPTTTNTFVLVDSVSYTLGHVVFQARNGAFGNLFDYSSVRLQYDLGSGPQSIFTSRAQLNNTDGGIASLWDWDVSNLGISSYSIFFNAADTSVSLDAVALDTQAVPEPSTWALLASGVAGFALLRRRRQA